MLGRGSSCFNYCLNSAWHGGDKFVSLIRLSMGLRCGEFAGQSSTPTPWSFNQLLVLLAVWAGAKSCWKMKSASLKSWSAEGSMKCSDVGFQKKTPLTTTVAKFLDTSVCGGSWCLDPSLSPFLWSSPKFLNWFCLIILMRLRFSRLVLHIFLPDFFLPLNFLFTCFDTALCEQPASLAMNVCGLPSLWRVSMIVFWSTVRSAVFPMIV